MKSSKAGVGEGGPRPVCDATSERERVCCHEVNEIDHENLYLHWVLHGQMKWQHSD